MPDPTDASQLSDLIGVGDPVDTTRPNEVSLDRAFIQSLLETSDFLGLLALRSA